MVETERMLHFMGYQLGKLLNSPYQLNIGFPLQIYANDQDYFNQQINTLTNSQEYFYQQFKEGCLCTAAIYRLNNSDS